MVYLVINQISNNLKYNKKMHEINSNLTIQVLSNFDDKYLGDVKSTIQPGFAVVKITDKILGNKETIFMIDGSNHSPALSIPDDVESINLSNYEDRKKLVVDLNSTEYWEKCNQQRNLFDVYEGESLYLMLIQDCQEIYKRVLKEHPEWLKK